MFQQLIREGGDKDTQLMWRIAACSGAAVMSFVLCLCAWRKCLSSHSSDDDTEGFVRFYSFDTSDDHGCWRTPQDYGGWRTPQKLPETGPVKPTRPVGLGSMQYWKTVDARPQPCDGAMWSKGLERCFDLRCGPNYRKNKRKQEAVGSMYECISVDILTGVSVITKIVDELIPVPPAQTIGNGRSVWSRSCGLPRVLCINVQLPYRSTNFFGLDDPGCSVVAVFHIKSETLDELQTSRHSSKLKLFKQFCDGPVGCLDKRVKSSSSSTNSGGVLKAIACCKNFDECASDMNKILRDQLHSYNGTKPCLITKSGQLMKDPHGEWMEISVDVRQFSFAATVLLSQCRETFATASLHIGFTIQGTEDEDLPEGLIGDLIVHNVHIVNHAEHVKEDHRSISTNFETPLSTEGSDYLAGSFHQQDSPVRRAFLGSCAPKK